MEQTTHLKHTVEKLDCALRRLQEVQSALRGHSPLPLISSDKIPELNRFNGDENHLVHSGSQRRWSMPTPLTHDALSDVVAVDKFAKKTVDMLKVQKKKQLAAQSKSISSYCPSQAAQTSLLQPSNRINLPQPVNNMSASSDAGWKQKVSTKENKRSPHQSKIELKDDGKLHIKGGLRSTMHAEEYGRGKSKVEASSLSNVRQPDKRTYSTRIAPEEVDVRSNIIKLRALMPAEEATTDPLGQGDICEETESKPQNHNATVKRSSLSMRTLMRMEDEEKNYTKPSVSKEGEDVDPFSSAMASKSFSVQLEEIKSSRKKSWNFTQQGKTSDKIVVMFPNPTFDEMTPPVTTPPEDHQKAMDSTFRKQYSLHEMTSAIIPSSTTMRNKALPSDTKSSFQKKEKIVRLSPCTTSSSHVQRPKNQVAPATACASTSKQESSATKKQKWRCTLTQPATPTLIRRLPEAHEMMEIKQANKTCVEGEETRYSSPDDRADDGRNSLTRSWSFGNPSVRGSSRMSSEARRSSLNPSGSQAFSFLSKHFQAWRLTSKQDK